jgi:hypothetical protein
MLEFNASISGRELPVCFGAACVSVVLPCADFVDEDLFVGNTAIQTLFG